MFNSCFFVRVLLLLCRRVDTEDYQVPLRYMPAISIILQQQTLTSFCCGVPGTSFLPIPFVTVFSSPFLSCSLQVVIQMGHILIVGSPPRYGWHYYREKDSVLSSLVDLRRIVPMKPTLQLRLAIKKRQFDVEVQCLML